MVSLWFPLSMILPLPDDFLSSALWFEMEGLEISVLLYLY